MKYSHDPSGNVISLSKVAATTVAPRIVRQPVERVVEPGGIASFSVFVHDPRGVTFQWRFNGAKIPGATKDTLLLTNVSAASVGEYRVVVRKGIRTVTSEPAALMLDQTSERDSDRDGVTNLEESREGTNPNLATSLRPRLVAYSDEGGSVAVSPMKLTYDLNETVTLTATPFAPNLFAGWAEDLTGSDNPATVVMNKSKTVRAKFVSTMQPPPGLVAVWRGETDANDLIGGHHGAFQVGENVTEPRLSNEGKVGGAFNFDGQVHMRVPDSSNLKPAQFTIEMWVFPNVAVENVTQTLIARASTTNRNAWLLELSSGKVKFWTQMPPGRHVTETPRASMAVPPATPLNQWTHLAATFDGTTKRIYVNGFEAVSLGVQGEIVYEPGTWPVIIGADLSSNAIRTPFRGRIDEVSLYNRALTADEIFTVWNSGLAGKNFAKPYFTSPSRLPDTGAGVDYAQQLATVLGSAPISFSLADGALPPGMTLSPAGMVSGASSASGLFDFTVIAGDAAGLSTEQMCLLQVS